MNLEKAPQGSIDVVSLTDCRVEDLDRVLAPFDIDNFCTKFGYKDSSDNEEARILLVIELAKFLRVKSSTHNQNLKRIQTRCESFALGIRGRISFHLDCLQVGD